MLVRRLKGYPDGCTCDYTGAPAAGGTPTAFDRIWPATWGLRLLICCWKERAPGGCLP